MNGEFVQIDPDYVYRFRAECDDDVLALRKILRGKLLKIQQTVTSPFPDVEVKIITKLTINEIKRAMEKVPDGHVMYETIALANEYTGERRRE